MVGRRWRHRGGQRREEKEVVDGVHLGDMARGSEQHSDRCRLEGMRITSILPPRGGHIYEAKLVVSISITTIDRVRMVLVGSFRKAGCVALAQLLRWWWFLHNE